MIFDRLTRFITGCFMAVTRLAQSGGWMVMGGSELEVQRTREDEPSDECRNSDEIDGKQPQVIHRHDDAVLPPRASCRGSETAFEQREPEEPKSVDGRQGQGRGEPCRRLIKVGEPVGKEGVTRVLIPLGKCQRKARQEQPREGCYLDNNHAFHE